MSSALAAAGPGQALERTARRYRSCGRFTRHYVASKLKRDPVHREMLALGAGDPFGIVADLGCGRGQVGLALLEAGLATSVIGLDWAGQSLDDARRAGAGLPFCARAQDLAADVTTPECDTLLLIDVLYSLQQAQALRLLHAAVVAARERIIVRTLDGSRGVRSRFHLIVERLARPFWPHSGAVVDPTPVAAMAAFLQSAGFAIEVRPCWQGTPFANVLLVARRRGA